MRLLTDDPGGRVAVETLVTTGLVHVAGEVSHRAATSRSPAIVRAEWSTGSATPRANTGFDGGLVRRQRLDRRAVLDIAGGVDKAFERARTARRPDDLQGAGDQGIMFGYATTETPQLMPMAIWTAHRIAERLAEVRRYGALPFLRPDGKTQVTLGYDGATATTVESVVALHAAPPRHPSQATARARCAPRSSTRSSKRPGSTSATSSTIINPAGPFVIGGPKGDAGLTGRKIIIDTYGGASRHGGGAFSGKDPSKVDRSAAYAMRWVAKNAVAAGLADRLEVQVAYAIGERGPSGCTSRRSAPATCPTTSSRPPSATCSTFAPRRSSTTSICCARSTRRPPPTATSAGSCPNSPGSAPTASTTCARPPVSEVTARPVARVLLDSPLPQLDRLFDYAIPEYLEADAQPGVRVRVPLRSAGRVVDGLIVERGEPDASDRPLSEIDAVVSPQPVLTPALYALARRAADRAAGSASDILRLALPKRMVRAEKAWLARGPLEAPVIDATSLAAANRVLGEFTGLADAIDDRGRVAVDAPPRLAHAADGAVIGAWAELLAAAAVRTLAAGGSAILVVPDHRDQSQLEAALTGRVPADARGAGRCPAELARAVLGVPARSRRCSVHRDRQSLGGVRAGARPRPARPVGRRRSAARRAS